MPLGAPPPAARARRGLWAEAAAADYLVQLGYQVLARRYRVPAGEVDLVARDGDVLAFVEVRFRSDAHVVPPLSTLGPRKLARIVRAARCYLSLLPPPWPPMRFDAVGVAYAVPGAGAATNEAALWVAGTVGAEKVPGRPGPATPSQGGATGCTAADVARAKLVFTLVRGAFDASPGRLALR